MGGVSNDFSGNSFSEGGASNDFSGLGFSEGGVSSDFSGFWGVGRLSERGIDRLLDEEGLSSDFCLLPLIAPIGGAV